jgi:hypothetical protein
MILSEFHRERASKYRLLNLDSDMDLLDDKNGVDLAGVGEDMGKEEEEGSEEDKAQPMPNTQPWEWSSPRLFNCVYVRLVICKLLTS